MKVWFKWARVCLFSAMAIGAIYRVTQSHQPSTAEAASVSPEEQKVAIEEAKTPLQRFQDCHATGESNNYCRGGNDEGYAAYLRSQGLSEQTVSYMLNMPVGSNTPYGDTAEGKAFLKQCCSTN